MTYTIRTEADGTIRIFTPAGNVAYTTASEPFVTTDEAKAKEALAYLNAKDAHRGMGKVDGSHWVKSTFGVL